MPLKRSCFWALDSLYRELTVYIFGVYQTISAKEVGESCSQKQNAQRRCFISAAQLVSPSPPLGAASLEQKDNK